jgi:hypothetical protein
MINFIKRASFYAFTFTFITIIIAFIIELIIYNNTKNDQYLLQADWHIKHKKQNKILFIGNSRTWVQVDVEFFSKKMKQKSYTIAQDGRNIKTLWYKLKKYLEINHKPEKIFLQFDPTFIEANLNFQTFYGKENYLTYLFFDNLNINKLFSNESGFEKYEEYIPLIRYINYHDLFIRHLMKRNHENTSDFNTNYKYYTYGSCPKNYTWGQFPEWKCNWKNPETFKYKKRLDFQWIDSVRILCSKKSINLILIYPPQSYTSYKCQDKKFIIDLKQYSQKFKIDYIDFNSKQYNDSTLFYNHLHLNKKGSVIYTNQIIDLINSSKFNP